MTKINTVFLAILLVSVWWSEMANSVFVGEINTLVVIANPETNSSFVSELQFSRGSTSWNLGLRLHFSS